MLKKRTEETKQNQIELIKSINNQIIVNLKITKNRKKQIKNEKLKNIGFKNSYLINYCRIGFKKNRLQPCRISTVYMLKYFFND